MTLTEHDQALLRAAAAGEDIYDLLPDSLSLTRAWQRINRLLEDQAAWEAEPAALLVLRKRRDARVRSRTRYPR